MHQHTIACLCCLLLLHRSCTRQYQPSQRRQRASSTTARHSSDCTEHSSHRTAQPGTVQRDEQPTNDYIQASSSKQPLSLALTHSLTHPATSPLTADTHHTATLSRHRHTHSSLRSAASPPHPPTIASPGTALHPFQPFHPFHPSILSLSFVPHWPQSVMSVFASPQRDSLATAGSKRPVYEQHSQAARWRLSAQQQRTPLPPSLCLLCSALPLRSLSACRCALLAVCCAVLCPQSTFFIRRLARCLTSLPRWLASCAL